jgi:hypothetical protein
VGKATNHRDECRDATEPISWLENAKLLTTTCDRAYESEGLHFPPDRSPRLENVLAGRLRSPTVCVFAV